MRLRVAIVADWLNNLGGAEQVVKELCAIYPQADIFTSVYDQEKTHGWFSDHMVTSSFLQKWPLAKKKHQLFGRWRPQAFESFDLGKYDVVISSSSAESKGVITKPSAFHVVYCHTPTRYYWSDYHEYKSRMEFGILNPIAKIIMPMWIHSLRIWDRVAAERPDAWIANSHYISQRISKYYKKDSTVIHPPVDTEKFTPLKDQSQKEDYFFAAGRVIPYKRVDLIVDAANITGQKVKIAGTGPMLEELKKKAKSNIEFLGRISDEDMVVHMQKASAFIFPAEEDFGIVPVEAMSCGTPVIAYGVGGALDTVIP
ncbi:MAG: glycosyltransferase [Patescibacteria group bacterium]|nr:glycosyltransferase [Patescibacteria group bacterium]